MFFTHQIRRFFQRVAKWSTSDEEAMVRRHWARRAVGQRSGFHLREFKNDMWRRGLRLAQTPFEHHLAMMRLFEKEIAPRLQPGSNARGSVASTEPPGVS
jgi:hypothetical protein